MNIKDATKQFLISRLALNCRPSTIRSYTLSLESFVAFVGSSRSITDVTPSLVRDYCFSCIGHLQASSINRQRAAILACLRWLEIELEQEELIPHINWRRRVPVLKEDSKDPRHLSTQESERLLAAVPILRRGSQLLLTRDRTIICVLLDSGLRRSELCNIRVSDVDIANRSVRITKSKGRRERTVFYGSTTDRYLHTYLRERRAYLGQRTSDALWITRTRSRLSHQELYDIVKDLSEIASVPDCGVHSLRHTCATMLLNNGYPLAYVQMILGHASVVMTQRYLHLVHGDISNAYKTACPVDKLRLA